jgi:F0F1-type ATP synthase assembly protein I
LEKYQEKFGNMTRLAVQGSPNIWRHLYAGTSLALTILLCTFVGVWIDRRWPCGPWGTVVGSFIGIGAGLYNFIREFSNESDDKNQGS